MTACREPYFAEMAGVDVEFGCVIAYEPHRALGIQEREGKPVRGDAMVEHRRRYPQRIQPSGKWCPLVPRSTEIRAIDNCLKKALTESAKRDRMVST
jgi:hypothetical protein